MANDSTAAGFLTPVSAPPAEDDALDNLLQEIVVGIVGLPGANVRPRWQPEPPKEPAANVDWCAFGVMTQTPEDTASVVHDGSGSGSDETQQHETITTLASFYGPAARGNAARLRDGLYIAQNRDEIDARGLAIIGVGQIIMAPDLINLNWRRRADIQIVFRRVVARRYQVRNLISVQGAVVTEDGAETAWLATDA